ncbi:MAG: hypothetical protein UZ22_OP11002000461 [Microgenomates bacterium OLB23]|nr:MAG: hypothetical protein UZ22_OP11002000461 [Microgenomates bacterium OLB23]
MNLEEYLQLHRKKFLIFDLDKTIVRLKLPWGEYLAPIEDTLNKIDPHILAARKQHFISLSEMQNKYCEKDATLVDFFKSYNNTFESQLQHYDVNTTILDFIKKRRNSYYFAVDI